MNRYGTIILKGKWPAIKAELTRRIKAEERFVRLPSYLIRKTGR